MDERSIHVSKGFLRTFALSGAWTVLGAGVYLFVGQASLAAGFLIVVGLGLVALAFRSSSLKDGDYPRGRLIVMAATGLSMLLLGLFLRVFAKGSVVVVWAAYFVGIALLLVVSAVQFTRSSRPEVS
ncbi:MAG: hypothetical protein ACC700_18410 [Anaerolineales bacterium]